MIGRIQRPRQDERGQAVSVMVLGFVAALIMVAGLVIDGGQKAAAISRAETLAAGAARAAANAGAGATLGSGQDARLASAQARRAATTYLAAASTTGDRVRGMVSVRGTTVNVRTDVTVNTIFLSLIGITTLRASGDATARMVPA
jgi:hypothetical protein